MTTTLTSVPLSTGVTLGVWDSGPKDAPALIFLHGFPESHRTWRHQIAHLSRNYRCIAPDQRGYGASSKPAEAAAYTPETLVADVFALAEALSIERFTILGHDWGGVIAWLVAIYGQFTGKVARAVIANAPHPTIFQRLLHENPTQRAASQYIRLFRDKTRDPQTRTQGLAPLLAEAFPGANPFAGLEPAELAALLTHWQDGETALAMLNWYRASPVTVPALAEPYELPENFPAPLPKLEIPTLVLWGEDDTALPPLNLEGVETHAPPARVVRLSATGHFSAWQAADAVNVALDEFLTETADAT